LPLDLQKSFAEETLQVRRVLSRVPTKMVKETGQSYVEAETKTEKSRRNIVLASFALEALKKHRESQLEIKEKAGDAWEEHDYVFCTSTGKYLHPGHDALVRFYPHLGSVSEAYPGTVSGSRADREQTGSMVFCSIFWQ